jgi:hypothetical protein
VASREQNQGDTDLTDQTDSTDRSSVGSAPCPTSREEVFDNSTPIAFGSPSSVRGIPRSLSKIVGARGEWRRLCQRAISEIRLIR